MYQTKKNLSETNFYAPLTPEKYAESIGEIRFLNPFTINGDICKFVTAVSALSVATQRLQLLQRVGRYFALGLPCAASSSF